MKPTIKGLLLLGACAGIVFSCSKGGDDNPPDPCSNITVVVSGNSVNPSTAGGNDGSISASATGGSGFTYSINGGSFQSGGNFGSLVAGTYTITARNSDGCTGTRQFTLSNPTANCTGVTITVTATSTSAAPCASPSAGSITASATGSTGFTYSINGSTFQASGNFSSLAPGNYTVTAKRRQWLHRLSQRNRGQFGCRSAVYRRAYADRQQLRKLS